MNNKILYSVLFVLISLRPYAQDFHFGIKAGANLNRFNLPDNVEKKTMGYTFGGFISYDFTKSIGIEVEGLYGRTGIYTSVHKEEAPSRKRISYLSIPILLKVNVTDFFSVLAGPQLNQLRNSGRYRSTDGSFAFPSGVRASLTAGVDLGPFYFRYLWGSSGFNNLGSERKYGSSQYQAGFRVRLL